MDFHPYLVQELKVLQFGESSKRHNAIELVKFVFIA